MRLVTLKVGGAWPNVKNATDVGLDEKAGCVVEGLMRSRHQTFRTAPPSRAKSQLLSICVLSLRGELLRFCYDERPHCASNDEAVFLSLGRFRADPALLSALTSNLP